jgi:hypothetical protein
MRRYWDAHLAEAAATDVAVQRAYDLVPPGRGFVVVTADHGELFGDRGDVLFEGQPTFGHGIASSPMEIHVPLGVRGPGVAPGSVDDVVSNVDVHGTVLVAAGLSADRHLRGKRSPVVVPLCNLWGLHVGNMTALVHQDGSQTIRSELPPKLGELAPLVRWTPGVGVTVLEVDSLSSLERRLLYEDAMPTCNDLQQTCEELGALGYVTEEMCAPFLKSGGAGSGAKPDDGG